MGRDARRRDQPPVFARATVCSSKTTISAFYRKKRRSVRHAHSPSAERRARMPIIVEVESLADVAEALTGQADIILLDNMTPVMVKKAVRMIKGARCGSVRGHHFEKRSCHGSGRRRPHFDWRAHALRPCRRDDAGAPTGRCQAEEASLTVQRPSPLNIHAIQSYLGTRSLGRRIELYERLESTNREAVALGQAGVEHGTLVLADAQTAGRGRMARSWFSPPGVNLYGSLVIRTTIEAPHLAAWLSWLPLMAALGAAEAIDIAQRATYCRQMAK